MNVRTSAAPLLALLAAAGTALAQGPAPPGAAPGSPIDALRARIAGQEQKPAEEVFKNVQVLKGVPAGRLLGMMENGFTRALGVMCNHCHVPGEWEKDDKPQKGIAREMIKMNRAIVSDYLRKIPNINSAEPNINCTTCHRGQVKPATSLGERPRAAEPGAPPSR